MGKNNQIKQPGVLALIGLSIIVAIAINVFFINGSDIGNKLKSNVIESTLNTNTADVYIKANTNNAFGLALGKNMNNIKTFATSIVYNADNIEIFNIVSPYGEVTKIQNEKGVISVMVPFTNAVSLDSENQVLFFQTQKKTNETEGINIIQTNFTDTNEDTFHLSSSGIRF